MELSVDEKYQLITRNLQECIGDENEIKGILAERPLKIYWGTACTSRIHIGYFVQMLKIADYLKAGCEITILFADLHAYLDNMKSSLELIKYRTQYYEVMIKEILKSMNIDITRLKFVNGTSFQLSEKYTMDVYRANSIITIKEAQRAGAEVVKQTDNPTMNGLLYPTLQALDEEYLGVDAETSGIDQRKIFMHARTLMPKLGFKKRHYFMTEMVPGLQFNTNNVSVKMSASDHDTKIDLLDTKSQIKTKINKCYCLSGDINDNCLMIILEKMIFPILEFKQLKFIINRKEKFGGPIIYMDSNHVKNDFVSQQLHPGDFKMGIIDSLDIILEPIRNAFDTPEMKKLLCLAYPNKL